VTGVQTCALPIYPVANSDARAASWDRNLVANINAYFDANGVLLGVDPNAASSGKLFVPDIDPPQLQEYMIGTAQQFTPRWSGRLYGRYRHADHFWEDTNNNARVCFRARTSDGACIATSVPSDAPSSIPKESYIPDLPAKLAAIGSGSSYVISELDGAFTKYYEATLESDWHTTNNNLFVKGSYTWSHYYGNFDQDNTTPVNDASVFIGSSFIGDGAGRQIWNNRYGDLRGDRRHMAKVLATYNLPWHASAGAVAFYQSGQPYELWSFIPWNPFYTASTSDSSRYIEPAGRRRTPSHQQLDLNYTQQIPLRHRLGLQIKVDLFNAFDKQTGYNFENRVGTLGPCTATTANCIDSGLAAQPRIRAPFARNNYAPRRFQVLAGIQF